MKKWILRAVLLSITGCVGYAAIDSYRAGYFSVPDLPDGAYPISFKGGFRAILLDAEVSLPTAANYPKFFRRLAAANRERRYLGVPIEVQPWFVDAWSWCETPTDDERTELLTMPEELQRMLENASLEGVCRIDVDGEKVLRGLLFSVPKL